jgi:hypothetical protein
MLISELTVVVPAHFTTENIREIIDKPVGINHDRHYDYSKGRDVVYYVPEENIDVVEKKLDEIKQIVSYVFGDAVEVIDPIDRIVLSFRIARTPKDGDEVYVAVFENKDDDTARIEIETRNQPPYKVPEIFGSLGQARVAAEEIDYRLRELQLRVHTKDTWYAPTDTQ